MSAKAKLRVRVPQALGVCLPPLPLQLMRPSSRKQSRKCWKRLNRVAECRKLLAFVCRHCQCSQCGRLFTYDKTKTDPPPLLEANLHYLGSGRRPEKVHCTPCTLVYGATLSTYVLSVQLLILHQFYGTTQRNYMPSST